LKNSKNWTDEAKTKIEQYITKHSEVRIVYKWSVRDQVKQYGMNSRYVTVRDCEISSAPRGRKLRVFAARLDILSPVLGNPHHSFSRMAPRVFTS